MSVLLIAVPAFALVTAIALVQRYPDSLAAFVLLLVSLTATAFALVDYVSIVLLVLLWLLVLRFAHPDVVRLLRRRLPAG